MTGRTGWIWQAIRWPNLLVMLLTQWMGFFFLTVAPLASIPELLLLNVATLFAAAAGNIINDYFDISTDLINKPDRVWIDRFFPANKVVLLYILLSGISLLASLFISLQAAFYTGVLILLLALYAWKFKRLPLIGNIIVSVCTAAVLLMFMVVFQETALPGIKTYALFAFLANHAREVIKDMEDAEGDKLSGARTLPLVTGNKVAMVLVLLLLALCLDLYYQEVLPYWRTITGIKEVLIFLYGCLLVLVPLMLVAIGMLQAKEKKDFTRLSLRMKLVMLTGICSMIFWQH